MARYREDEESCALWEWAQFIPELRDCLYHIPNGGKRNPCEAARMKKMGVRAGVADYHLPVPRGAYTGLWIELKATPPHDAAVQSNQREWLGKMQDQGAVAVVCKGWMQAKRVIEWYLTGK